MNKKLVSAVLLPGLAIGANLVSVSGANALTQSDIDQLSATIDSLQAGDTRNQLQDRLAALKITLATETIAAAAASPSVGAFADAKAKVAAVAAADRPALETTLGGHIQTFATAAKANAVATGTRADRIAASTAVALMYAGASKTGLEADIAALEAAAVTAAENALTAARAADNQSTLTTAEALVAKVVGNGDLLIQVQVQKAQVALAAAVASGKLVDLNAAQVLVDALPFDAFAAPVEDRADVVAAFSSEITSRQAGAAAAVATAEGAKTQANHDAALAKVNELPAAIAAIKAGLVSRLAAVQSAIASANSAAEADATSKVVTAEGSRAAQDVTNANNAIAALPAGSVKSALTDRMTYVALVISTTAKVVTAETTATQANHDAAATDVAKLVAGAVKTDLSSRLAVVQATVKLNDATAKVNAAVASDRKVDWDAAAAAVSALADSGGKTAQQTALNNQLPETLVKEAEESDTQADLDIAVGAVGAMPAGNSKTALNLRVVAQQALLITNATNAVVSAEASNNYKDRDAALALVNALPASATKSQLVTRLADIAAAVETARPASALANAVASDTQADLNYAKTLIDALPGNTAKDNLLAAVATQQTSLNNDAQTAVTGATTQAQVTAALNLVSALNDGSTKTNGLAALVIKQKALDDAAIALVVAAEGHDVQAPLDTAKAAVDLLKAGSTKTALLERIAAQQVIVTLTAEIKAIEASVTNAATKQAEIDAVLLKVEALADSTSKTYLLREIDGVQKVSNLLNSAAGAKRDTANATVSAAETNYSQADVTAAAAAIAALPDGQLKTRLTPRLAVVSAQVTAAETAVAYAEANKTQANLDAAVLAVAGLPASSGKTAFTARNNVVKAIIDGVNASNAIDLAVSAVDAAVAADTAASLAVATNLVSALPAGDLKSKLQGILAVQGDVVARLAESTAAAAAQASAEAAATAAEAAKTAAESDKAAALAAKTAAESDKAAALAAKTAAESDKATAVAAKLAAEAAKAAAESEKAAALAAKAEAESKAAALQAIIDAQEAAQANAGSSVIGVGFTTGSSKISASTLSKLVAAAKAVKSEHNLVSISVTGVGAKSDLALTRAVAIISALKKAGINVKVNLSTSVKAASTARVVFNWQD